MPKRAEEHERAVLDRKGPKKFSLCSQLHKSSKQEWCVSWPRVPILDQQLSKQHTMNYDAKAIIGWALPMIAIPAMPIMATAVPEPSTILVIGVAILIGVASAFVGRLFDDGK